MSILQTVYDTLSGDAGVTAIVGSKIYPVLAPEDTDSPFVTYIKTSATPENILKGSATISQASVLISCYHTSVLSVNSLAQDVITAFDGIGYVEFERDTYESSTKLYSTKISISIHYGA